MDSFICGCKSHYMCAISCRTPILSRWCWLKGTRSKDTSRPENIETMQVFPLAGFRWLYCQCLCKSVFWGFKFELLWLQPCWFALHQWIMHASATHAGLLVHHLTHCHFCNFQTLTSSKLVPKLTEKLLQVSHFSYSTPTDMGLWCSFAWGPL